MKTSKINQLSIKESLEKLLKQGPVVKMAPAPEFPYKLSQAYKWSIPQVIKYLNDVMELPQYINHFLRATITGRTFIGLHSSNIPESLCDVDHQLHLKKILSHASRLREQVLQSIHIKNVIKSKKFFEWEDIEIAAYLYQNQCPNSAIKVIITQKNGLDMISMTKDELEKLFHDENTIDSKERIHSILIIQNRIPELKSKLEDLLKQNQNINTNDFLTSYEEKEEDKKRLESGLKLESKSKSRLPKTAIRRRKQEKNGVSHPIKSHDVLPEHEKNEKKEFPPHYKDSGKINEIKNMEEGDNEMPPEYNDEEENNFDDNNDLETSAKSVSFENSILVKDNQNLDKNHDRNWNKNNSNSKSKNKNTNSWNESKNIKSIQDIDQDRNLFLQKITELQNTISKQSKAIQQLTKVTHKLEHSHSQYQNRIDKEQHITNNVIEALELDRDTTTNLLSNLIEKYVESGVKQTQSAKDDLLIKLLAEREHLEQHKKQDKSMDTPPILSNVSSESLHPLNNSSHSNHPIVSDFNVSHKLSVDQTMDNLLHSSHSTDSIQTINTMHTIHPSESVQSIHRIDIIQPTVSQNSNSKKFIHKSMPIKLIEEININRIIEQDTNKLIHLWEELIHRYSIKEQSILYYSDSRMGLSHIAMLWMKLGQHMLDDYEEYVEKHRNKIIDAEYDRMECIGAIIVCIKPIIESIEFNYTMDKSTKMRKDRQNITIKKSSNLNDDSDDGIDNNGEDMNQYMIEVGMVFVLGLVKRILHGFTNNQAKSLPSDKNQLMMLLSKLQEGNLPITELSRENIRNLMSTTLGIKEISWDQFDSICQRLDPSGRGFITLPKLIDAFIHIPPITDTIPSNTKLSNTFQSSPSNLCQAMYTTQYYMTIVTESIGNMNMSLSNAIQSIISNNMNTIDSFKYFVDRKKENDMVQNTMERDMNVMLGHDIELISDMMITVVLKHYPIVSNHTSHSTSIFQNKHKSVLSSSHIAILSKVFKTIDLPIDRNIHTHMIAMENIKTIAKGLGIYLHRIAQHTSILTDYGILVSTYYKFRLYCIRSIHDFITKGSKSIHTSIVRSSYIKDIIGLIKNEILIEDMESYMMSMEVKIVKLLNKMDSHHSDSSANISLPSIDVLLSNLVELLGIHIPVPNLYSILLNQIVIEIILIMTSSYPMKSDSRDIYKNKMDRSHSLDTIHSRNPIHAIHRDIIEDMLQSKQDVESNHKMYSKSSIVSLVTTSININDSKNNLINDVNSMVHEQRIEQISKYLNRLNGKAQKKRKIIENLLMLLRQTKKQGRIPNHPIDFQIDNSVETDHLTIAQIGEYTNNIERKLYEELAETRPTIELQQEQRIVLLKQALWNGSISDPNGSIAILLEETNNLERSLLQANKDAMKLIGKITQLIKRF